MTTVAGFTLAFSILAFPQNEQAETVAQLNRIEWQLREINTRLTELTAAFTRYQELHNREASGANARLTELLVGVQAQISTSNQLMQRLYERLEESRRDSTSASSAATVREDARANQFDRSIVLLIVSALVTTVMGATAGAVAMRRAMRNGRNEAQ